MNDSLVRLCEAGDFPAVLAALAHGANVNERGRDTYRHRQPPLAAAVRGEHYSLVLHLLSLDADPNGDEVMGWAAWNSTPAILQLLIDAGGDVNRASGGRLPVFVAMSTVFGSSRFAGARAEPPVTAQLRVLLDQPSLDLSARNYLAAETTAAADARRRRWVSG